MQLLHLPNLSRRSRVALTGTAGEDVIRNPEKQQLLSVSYPSYNEIKGEQFPENINIRATDNKNLTTINIEYRSVEFNNKLTFPFSIPSGYKEISLK